MKQNHSCIAKGENTNIEKNFDFIFSGIKFPFVSNV